MKWRTALLALCLAGTPAWAPADSEVDAEPIIDPASNQRVQDAIDQRSDGVAQPKPTCTRIIGGSYRRTTECGSPTKEEKAGVESVVGDLNRQSRPPPPSLPPNL